jgi:hypothetical protein
MLVKAAGSEIGNMQDLKQGPSMQRKEFRFKQLVVCARTISDIVQDCLREQEDCCVD